MACSLGSKKKKSRVSLFTTDRTPSSLSFPPPFFSSLSTLFSFSPSPSLPHCSPRLSLSLRRYSPDLTPDAGLFYRDLAKRCSAAQVSVDIFVCPRGWADVASLSVLPTLTGGALSYMPEFDASDPNDTAKLRDGVCLRAGGIERSE